MATIGDLVPLVAQRLSNRTDVSIKSIGWLVDSVKDITASYPFSELQVTGPTVQLTINKAEYLKTYFFNPGDVDITMVDSFFFYINGSSGTGYNLKFRTLPTIETLSKIAGQPVFWTRHGKLIILGPMPNATYSVYQRYQLRHPFTQQPANDTILIADDWLEIVVYAAAMRGAWDERMYDYSKEIKTLLYGDPLFQQGQGKGQPGLIHAKVAQFTRDASNNERQVQPRVSSYNVK